MFVETKKEGEAIATPKLEPWRQLLLDSADYIEKHGWARDLRCGQAVCIRGAMLAVLGLLDDDMAYRRHCSHPLFAEADEKLSDYVGRITKRSANRLGDLGYWNNQQPSPEPVLQAARACARQGI